MQEYEFFQRRDKQNARRGGDMAVRNLGMLVGPDLSAVAQMRWVVRLAEARDLDLIVLQHVESKDRGSSEIPLDGSAEGEVAATAREILQAIEENPLLRAGPRPEASAESVASSGASVIHVRMKQIRCAGFRALRDMLGIEVQKSDIELCTILRKELGGGDAELVKQRQLFLRYAPCEVVHCSGFSETSELSRILVTVASGAHGKAALRLACDLAAGFNATLTALRVNPTIGPDAERVGALRMDNLLRKTLGKEHAQVTRRVVVDDHVHRGVRRVWDEGQFDLVVAGASRVGILGSMVEGSIGAKLVKGESAPTVAIVSAASPMRNRFFGFVQNGIERLVPQIDRENRVVLVDRVQSSSSWDFDFSALMVLSTLIAAVGLIQNAPAVVIGAMLVAPLMTPLLGLGLALVQGNPVLARISVHAIVFGVMVAILVGVLVGLLTPGFQEPTREMLGRGGPGVLDLCVAFASGLAAAYASSRPGLLAALPGVAIAAALVPPIATCGLALSLGNFDLAFNALLLFVINMVTIVLATVVSLWLVGLRNIKRMSRWTVRAGGAVLLAVLALGIYLSLYPPSRATEIGLPSGLMQAIQQPLGDDYRLEGIAIAYDEIGVQLNVRVVGEKFASEDLAQEIRTLARGHFKKPVRVRLLTQVEAGEVPPRDLESSAVGNQVP